MDQGWRSHLSACWETVSASLPPLSQLNLRQCLPASWPSFTPQEEVWVNGRRFNVIKLLGEGGYSFVYLVREVPTSQRPNVSHRRFALKKVLIGSQEQLQAAQREIDVMRKLRHPNLMPLLDASIDEAQTPGGIRQVAHMLFPLYEAGSLWDLVQSRLQHGTPLPLREVLCIFIQVCAALQAMHSMEPALAHRDVKPHNVLLQRLRNHTDSTEAVDPHHQPEQQNLLRPGGGKMNKGGGPSYLALPPSGLTAAEEEFDGLELQQLVCNNDEAAVGEGEPAGGLGVGEYHAVLMDFGSTKPARVEVFNRTEAMGVQEDAEAHCTAPYRAPELWDVPSCCSLDERVDVWSVGCLLYFMMSGESPFERVLSEAGGSLMLAVINGRVSWPPEWQDRCPPALQELVMACLDSNPSTRPYITEVKRRAEQLLTQMPS